MVPATGRQVTSIWSICDTVDTAGVPFEGEFWHHRGYIPDFDGLVAACRCHRAAVRCKDDGDHGACMFGFFGELLSAWHVPDLDDAVAIAGQQFLPLGI